MEEEDELSSARVGVLAAAAARAVRVEVTCFGVWWHVPLTDAIELLLTWARGCSQGVECICRPGVLTEPTRQSRVLTERKPRSRCAPGPKNLHRLQPRAHTWFGPNTDAIPRFAMLNFYFLFIFKIFFCEHIFKIFVSYCLAIPKTN
jgi:hypothetical protein